MSLITPAIDGYLVYGFNLQSIITDEEITQTIVFIDVSTVQRLQLFNITQSIVFSGSIQYTTIKASINSASSTLIFIEYIVADMVYRRTLNQTLNLVQSYRRPSNQGSIKSKPWLRLTRPDVVNKL